MCAQDRQLLGVFGITHDRLEQEAVELGLRQRIRPFVLDGVLGRQDEERVRKHARLALEGDLLLLHRLEQGGLRFRWRAVDLIGEDDVREDRTLLDAELARGYLVHGRTDDVARHEIGCELDPLEGAPDEMGDGAREERLRGTGHSLDEEVTSEHERDESEAHRLVLAHDDAMHVAMECLGDLARPAGAHRDPPTRRSTSRTLRRS